MVGGTYVAGRAASRGQRRHRRRARIAILGVRTGSRRPSDRSGMEWRHGRQNVFEPSDAADTLECDAHGGHLPNSAAADRARPRPARGHAGPLGREPRTVHRGAGRWIGRRRGARLRGRRAAIAGRTARASVGAGARPARTGAHARAGADARAGSTGSRGAGAPSARGSRTARTGARAAGAPRTRTARAGSGARATARASSTTPCASG